MHEALETAVAVVAAAATLALLQACSFGPWARLNLEPLRVNHFYTTSYSGEVEARYEALLRTARTAEGEDVALQSAPPQVTRFRHGERVCVAAHSDPTERWRPSPATLIRGFAPSSSTPGSTPSG